MEKKKIITIIMLSLIIIQSILISASESPLRITFEPHYYQDSREILVYNNETEFDGISFDIYGENILSDSRIINIEITKTSPDIFDQSITKRRKELRILQDKLLWETEIIDLNQYSNGQNITFLLGIEAINEKNGNKFYIEKEYILKINKNAPKEGFFYSIGKTVYPSKPNIGIWILFILIIMVFATIWYSDMPKKLEDWKKKKRLRKLEEMGKPEAYY